MYEGSRLVGNRRVSLSIIVEWWVGGRERGSKFRECRRTRKRKKLKSIQLEGIRGGTSLSTLRQYQAKGMCLRGEWEDEELGSIEVFTIDLNISRGRDRLYGSLHPIAWVLLLNRIYIPRAKTKSKENG